jgi:hypothetical protein
MLSMVFVPATVGFGLATYDFVVRRYDEIIISLGIGALFVIAFFLINKGLQLILDGKNMTDNGSEEKENHVD